MGPIHKVLQAQKVLESPFGGYGLSTTEKEILTLALKGHSNQGIAEAMNLPAGTVNAYGYRAQKKIGVTKSELGWFVIERLAEILK